ncbi:MAG: 3-isopropylmalate dehydratase small subunit [Microscillaceae bacterium]|nr:3-isopropylmalate dehydratase small subunit [Microscillaceae bacterium]
MPSNLFKQLRTTAVPLPIENVDTDQIIPARYLKATTREGFGDNLFRDWRYLKDGTPNPDFVLNNPRYRGQILLAGKNFGCGSSREHAAWALADYGFRAVVSSFFADIFQNNALNNQLLPVVVSEEVLSFLMQTVQAHPETECLIDLESQTFQIPALHHATSFALNPYKKMCLMEGLADLDYLLSLRETIAKYEQKQAFW